MSNAAKAISPAVASPIVMFQVISAVKLPWRSAINRQLNEYKAMEHETFTPTETFLVVKSGTRSIGIPWSNVRYVEFA